MSANEQASPDQIEPALPMCGVCRNDPPVNGIRLKCSHIFCFLCIKSASETTGVCPLCRDEIGHEFNYQEHAILGTIQAPTSADGYYWFYEGYRGWWLFDAETNREIEAAHQEGTRSVLKFIAGGYYVIDLETMQQRRQDEEHGRTRRICRATLDLDNIIGMAGLKGQDFKDALEMMRMADSLDRPNN